MQPLGKAIIETLLAALPALVPPHHHAVPSPTLPALSPHPQVLHTFRTMQPVRKAIVETLLAASTAFVRAKRITSGTALQYAVSPPPPLTLVWAALLSVLLAPVHALAKKLVYKKVRAGGARGEGGERRD